MIRYLRNNKAKSASDADLLTRFQKEGNKEALAILFDRYLELVYGLCLRYLGTPDRAEDGVMGVYIALQEKVAKHDIQYFKNWLHTFVRNHCLMQLRKEKKNKTQSFDPAIMQSAEIWHPIEKQQEENALHEMLAYCLTQLNEKQKHCVQLFYYQGHSYKEIADMESEELGKIRSYIQNGRRNLKNCIEKQEQDD